MKLNKKIIKKNKKNKKKQKKVVKNNIDVVSEKISFALDRADSRLIKNITTILGPKLALKICNQTSDVEETGGLNDPQLPSKRLSKLESFLYLIQHDSSISENKKNSIKDQKNSASLAPVTPKIDKKKQKRLKQKVKGIQSELDKLCLNQIKNEAKNPTSSNYFAIQNISKLDDCPGSKLSSLIKPSKFNLSLSNGVPSLTPNFSNSLINRPRLDLNQINFEPNGSIDGVKQNSSAFGSLQSSFSSLDHARLSGDSQSQASSSVFAGSTQLDIAPGEVAVNSNAETILVNNLTHVTSDNISNNGTNNFARFNQLPSTPSNVTASAGSTSSNNVASLFSLSSNSAN